MNEEQVAVLAILLTKHGIPTAVPEYIREKIEQVQRIPETPERLLDDQLRPLFNEWAYRMGVRRRPE